MQPPDYIADLDGRDRRRALRLVAACCIASVVLHGALLFVKARNGAGRAGVNDTLAGLRVALAPGTGGDIVEPISRGPLPFLPRIDSARLYPRLLDFVPIDLPQPQFDEAAYLPLNKLTVPPTAARPIDIVYPDAPAHPELLIASLTLFINEDGSVAEVRTGAPHAPEAYERAAVEAFSKARFNPGKVGKAPVKSRMVIRVAFDGGAPPEGRSSSGIRVR